MKLYSIYRADTINEDEVLKDKIYDLIQKHYSHLRHSLRRHIPVDEFLINEILTTVKNHYIKRDEK